MTRKEILEKTIDFDDAIHRIVRLEKENANLKKSCDETQELLDKQIEATYKLDKENAELKHESRAKENCWNCAYFKEKKYQACIDIKKNKTIRCAFYKWEGEK